MAALTACCLALLAAAAPATPSRWVADEAHVLSPETRLQLDRRLETFQRQTGHQVLVYIAPTTGGAPIEDWANEAFAAWGVGRAGLDDGAVLFVFTDDHAARIEVGYGLEERLNDATASQIINEVLAPKMAAGLPDAAITQAVDAMLKVIGPEGTGPAEEPLERAPPSPLKLALYIVGAIVLLVLFWRNPGLALFLLSVLTRRGGGGNGRGGGGFGGGGGRSGGGGATGRW